VKSLAPPKKGMQLPKPAQALQLRSRSAVFEGPRGSKGGSGPPIQGARTSPTAASRRHLYLARPVVVVARGIPQYNPNPPHGTAQIPGSNDYLTLPEQANTPIRFAVLGRYRCPRSLDRPGSNVQGEPVLRNVGLGRRTPTCGGNRANRDQAPSRGAASQTHGEPPPPSFQAKLLRSSQPSAHAPAQRDGRAIAGLRIVALVGGVGQDRQRAQRARSTPTVRGRPSRSPACTATTAGCLCR
jgi:hypothetical protein